MSRLVSLRTWAVATYGEDAPSDVTLRRWVKAGKIQPAPVKHGRSYYVSPDAAYTDRPKPRLAERLHAESRLARPAV